MWFEKRWWQLGFAFVTMMMVSSPQYVWTLFISPLEQQFGASLTSLQYTFTILVVLQALLSPVQGYLVDRFGPQRLITAGVVVSGLSWVAASTATNLGMLYLTYGVLGGIGTGIVYVGTIGVVVRWFPDRRGLAAGVAAAGYGVGAILTTFPISGMLATSGVSHTLLVFGFAQAIVGLFAAIFLRMPANELAILPRSGATRLIRNFATSEMVKTPLFWLLFVMMTIMATSGLMVTANVGPVAKEYGLDKALVFGLAALPLSLSLSRLANGFTRPFFGWVSDHIGREQTMTIAFSFEALAILALMLSFHNPTAFVLLTGLAFFGWGEIFSLFPSILTDSFGTEHATANYGVLYIAFGVGSVFGGPLAAQLRAAAGSWTPVFLIVMAFDALTAIAALTILKPLRRQMLSVSPRQPARNLTPVV